MAERFEGQSELRARRVQKGLSQDELAAKLGVRQGTVSNWETDDGRRPTTFVLRKKIQRLLGVPVEMWLSSDERRHLESIAKLRRLPTQESPRKRAAKERKRAAASS